MTDSEGDALDVLDDMKRAQEQCYVDGNYIVVHEDSDYDLHLSKLDTPEKILGAVLYLIEKKWMDRLLLEQFVQCAADAHGIDVERL